MSATTTRAFINPLKTRTRQVELVTTEIKDSQANGRINDPGFTKR